MSMQTFYPTIVRPNAMNQGPSYLSSWRRFHFYMLWYSSMTSYYGPSCLSFWAAFQHEKSQKLKQIVNFLRSFQKAKSLEKN